MAMMGEERPATFVRAKANRKEAARGRPLSLGRKRPRRAYAGKAHRMFPT